MFNESEEAGIGIVVRDSTCQVLASLAKKFRQPSTVENLEILAARRAVIFAAELGLQQAHFEGDSELEVKALQMGTMFSSSFGHLAKGTFNSVVELGFWFRRSKIKRQYLK